MEKGKDAKVVWLQRPI